jgi:hypothetical protein
MQHATVGKGRQLLYRQVTAYVEGNGEGHFDTPVSDLEGHAFEVGDTLTIALPDGQKMTGVVHHKLKEAGQDATTVYFRVEQHQSAGETGQETE